MHNFPEQTVQKCERKDESGYPAAVAAVGSVGLK